MTHVVENSSHSCPIQTAAEYLKAANDILILFHTDPDGDAVGSAFSFCRALQKMGKRARCECSDPVPKKYGYLLSGVRQDTFEPKCIVSVDMAAPNLFGDKLAQYADKVDLCIDHHVSNTFYARNTLLDGKAAAACEIMADLIELLGVEIDVYIASSIYTGLSTDTGCFRYSNTTPKTLRCAADMIEKGACSAQINKDLFETASKGRLEMERRVLNTLEYFHEGRTAMVCITSEMCEKAGVEESELEGLPSLPARIAGVLAGVTVREQSPGSYKISVRTNRGLNASGICSAFGGGGHAAAAGCRMEGNLDSVRKALIETVGKALKNWDERNLMH